MNTNILIIVGVGGVGLWFLLQNQGVIAQHGPRVLQLDDAGQSEARLRALELLGEERARGHEKALAMMERDTALELQRQRLAAEELELKTYEKRRREEHEFQLRMQREERAGEERRGFFNIIGSAISALFAGLLSDQDLYNDRARRFMSPNAGQLELMRARRSRGGE